MAPGEAIRRMRLSDLNGSEEDPDLDLTLSLSVGDSRRKKVVSLEQTGCTRIANPRNTNGFCTGAPLYCPSHAKLSKLERSADTRSSSVVMSEQSRTVQGSVSNLSTTGNNSCFASTGASVERHQLRPHPSTNSFPSCTNANISRVISHVPCVTVRDSRPGNPRAIGFIYQVSSAADVVIVCTCHWRAFSAAGFVEHAGLTNVKNPLREIVVLPPSLPCMIGLTPSPIYNNNNTKQVGCDNKTKQVWID